MCECKDYVCVCCKNVTAKFIGDFITCRDKVLSREYPAVFCSGIIEKHIRDKCKNRFRHEYECNSTFVKFEN